MTRPLGTLGRLRSAVADLRARIDEHNQAHPRPRPPDGEEREVTVYLGQYVKTNDSDEMGDGDGNA